jgi:hypothetical protein
LLYIDENCAEDPTFHLKQLADVQGIASTKVKYMALGANNGKVATDLLDTAFIRGQVNQGSFINDVTPLGTGQGTFIDCIEDLVPMCDKRGRG